MAEEEPVEEPESLWEKVLAEHRASAQETKDRDDYRVFILGSPADGKEKVLASLKGAADDDEELVETHGLGFSFCEFKDKPIGEDEDVRVRLLLTVLEKESMQCLLPAYFLRPNSSLRGKWLETAVFIITVDMSAPHSVLQTLNTWYGHLEALLAEMEKDGKDQVQKLRDKVERECDAFLQACEPASAQKKKAAVDAELVVLEKPSTDDRSSRNLQAFKKMGLFEKGNLGVPIVVVGTKMDALMRQAEATQQRSKDHYLNFIQASLRKWCVQRGAGLVYTSADKQVNCDVLREYLLLRLARIPMTAMLDSRRQLESRVPKALMGNESLFWPAFADSLPKILQLPLGSFADKKFGEVVTAPPKKDKDQDKRGVVEPFQEWLKDAKKRADEGPSLTADRADKPRQAGTKALEALRAKRRDGGDGGGGGADKTLEHTAERFFNDMIKTYQRDGNGPRASGAPRSSARTKKPADAPAAAKPP
eukprot:TRINITY_DN1435_c0_g2_i1.p1 TRINITY_DN1435_c0_g2~~TRINITY_DN1435_c0_g2_i1.p1  ORF type:complete len:478 (+),score=202.14 TRINITY_DN1435_c0_g2_i1:84-1517(+)